MVEIRRFDPEHLEELAQAQTAIYNAAIAELPESTPVKVEDVIKRFKREIFDQARMFYAYEGDKMVGYVGLTGKNTDDNSRGIGYPWLLKGASEAARDLLYDEMEKQCQKEGTKKLLAFGTPNRPKQSDFYKSKGFQVTQEFLIHQKKLSHEAYTLPAGYSIRALTKADLPILEEVSRNDPKMKSPFVAIDYENYMESSNYDPENVVVAEKDNEVIGYFSLYIPTDPERKKVYFAGVAVHGEHQEIEPFLMRELENRAFARGKELVQTTFYPDSPRLPFALEQGFKQTAKSIRLEKHL